MSRRPAVRSRHPIARRAVRVVGRLLAAFLCAAGGGCLMLMLGSPALLTASVAIVVVVGAVLARRLSLALGFGAALVCVVFVWVVLRSPSHHRTWASDLAVLPVVTLEGDLVKIDGVRHFDWTSAEAPIERWETREYSLSKLRGVEVIVEPFALTDAVAHTMLSFDFADEGRLLLSIEARREVGESYNPLSGALRQYELIYVFADERDALVLRACNRGARLYAYPAKATPEFLRSFFRLVCEEANAIRAAPRFYHIIKDNCTTVWVRAIADVLHEPYVLHPDVLLNGRVGRLLYRAGHMDTDLTYEQARERFRIDERIRRSVDEANLSERIRAAPSD